MKKLFSILLVYVLLIFACCIGETFLYRTVPNLISTDVMLYRFFRGLWWFLTLLPAVLLSGFTVSCAMLWRYRISNSKRRFSAAMIERYKLVMIASLIFVCILAFNAEIFRPLVKGKLTRLENGPAELEASLRNAELFLVDEKYELAYLHAHHAVALAPRDTAALAMLKRSSDELSIYTDTSRKDEKFATVEDEQKPLYAADHSYTVKEMMAKAQAAMAEDSWFDAHYWASLAVEACNGTDTNLERARSIAEYAWTQLKNPKTFEDSEENLFYRRKREAYIALNEGDFLTAYYIFLELRESRRRPDPDVERYFALSKEAVENDYFFIDETEHMDLLSNAHDVYFSLRNPDGSKDVFYIESIMDSKVNGKLVRYLKDFYVASYTADGRFERLMKVPLVKAISQPVSSMSEDARALTGVSKSWRNVPYLKLMAVDRNTHGVESRPVYSYSERGLPNALRKIAGFREAPSDDTLTQVYSSDYRQPNTMLLPMPYGDFTVIDTASSGFSGMAIVAMMQFIRRAKEYGFASEVFTQSLVSRVLYPLFILILFIFAAIIGWNYRMEGEQVHFRTSWLPVVILYGFCMFLMMEIGMYLFNVFNYVLVGAFKGGALATAAIIYGCIFVAVSLLFMSRKV